MRKILLSTVFAAMLAGAGVANAYATNQVVNGDFETGDFSGWTLSGNTGHDSVLLSGDSHSYYWNNSATGTLGEISQTIATVTGAAYTLSFDLRGTGNPSKIKVYFGDDLVPFAQTNFNYSDWTHFTISGLVADSNHSVLMFGSRNDFAANRIDNITLTASVPEPETYAMLLAGLGLMGTIARRRKSAPA